MPPKIQPLISSKPSLSTVILTTRKTFHLFSSPFSSSSSHRLIPPKSPIISLLLSNKPLEAASILHRSTSPLPPKLYNSTLAALSANAPIEHAQNLFDIMLHRKIELNDVGFGCFIKRLCNSKQLPEIMSLAVQIRGMGHQVNGSVVAALVVDGLCRTGKIDDAWAALGELRVIGWKPDFIAYRIVSEGFRLANRLEETGRILKQKRKFGVAPRVGDYRDFVLWLISERRIREAKELGEAIVYGDFPIDDDVLESLIGSVSDVDPNSAMILFKYVIRKDRLPSIGLLRYLSGNLSKSGLGDELYEVFRVLLDKNYFCEVEQYDLMVLFLCEVGKLREAHDVMREMRKKGFIPNVSTYNLLMEACCSKDLLRPAKKLWDEMFAYGCSANLRTYNILIGKLLEEGEVEEARQLFRHMVGRGIIPDNVTYKMLITVLCKEKNVEGAVEIFNKSMEQDLSLAISTLSQLILALCNAGNRAAASFILHGIPSNIEDSGSHVILLKSLTDAGEFQMAIEHMEWIKKNSPFKLQSVLTELIASLSTAPKLDPVLQLLRLMHAQGFVSNEDSWFKLLEVEQKAATCITVDAQRCDLSSVEIGITNTGKMFGYDPVFEVEVRNTCRCTLIDVLLRSEGFTSSMSIDPKLFRREGFAYLVNDGKGIPSSQSVKFQYSWDRPFKMTPLSFQIACW